MALKKSGVQLVAEGFATYRKSLQEIDKLHKQAFNTSGLDNYNKAVDSFNRRSSQTKTQVDSTWKLMENLHKAFDRNAADQAKGQNLPIPPVDDVKKLEDALKTLGDSGKFNVSKISDETLKLRDALSTVKATGQFDVGAKEAEGFAAVLENIGGFVGSQLTSIFLGFGGVLASVFSVNYIVSWAQAMEAASVAANSQFEKYETQFTTLLGGVGQAKKRISELAEFGIKTPYELPELVQADRLLQTFGGTALATGENLRRIGDAAAAVSANFGNVSFWMGRLYSSMQSGRPFGAAAMRMQQLGIMSGDTRNKLEAMRKAGKSGTEMWAFMADYIDKKFAGAMDRLSLTMEGVQSNISDLQGKFLRIGGEEYFKVVREDATKLYQYLSKPETQNSIMVLSKGLGHMAAELSKITTGKVLEVFERIDSKRVKDLGDAVYNLGTTVGKFNVDAKGAAEGANGFVSGLSQLLNTISLLATPLTWLFRGQARLTTDFLKAAEATKVYLLALNPLIPLYTALTGKDLAKDLGELSGAFDKVKAPLTDADHQLDALGQNLYDTGDAAATMADDMAEATKEAKALQVEIEGQIEALEATKGAYEKAQSIHKNYLKTQADAEKDYNKQLQDASADYFKKITETADEGRKKVREFDADSAKKREDILQDFQDKQSDKEKDYGKKQQKLQEDYEKNVAKIKKKSYDDQARALRDFQLSQMQEARRFEVEDRRMRADGDVLALMEARENYDLQQQEAKENFANQQKDSTDSADERLAEAKDNLAEQQAEAKAALEEQTQDQRDELQKRLEEFDANTAEQRQKLIDANNESLKDMRDDWEVKKEEMQTQYEEKLALADEQYQQELQALGDSMAEQGKVTEDGMRAIATKISETFGEEGAGDALMKGWSERSKDVMNNTIDSMTKKVEELKKQLKDAGDDAEALKAIKTPASEARGGSMLGLGNIFSQAQGMAEGGEGVVKGPAHFFVEPGVQEYVKFVPMNKGSMAHSGSLGLNVSGLPAGLNEQLESAIMEKAADLVVNDIALVIDRLKRRG